MELVIRDEEPADAASVHALNVAAFATEAEALLVDALRASGRLTLSLVAAQGAAVVGHIAFSPLTVTRSDGRILEGVGLGPMAVAPARQRSGIGTRLLMAGLARLGAAGHPFCIVLGHRAYYPRFGFEPASRFGMRWERAGAEGSFFALELAAGGLADVSGVVRYAPEFAVKQLNARCGLAGPIIPSTT